MDCSPPDFSVHGISRQEYWSGLPFPSPGDLLDPGIKPTSPVLQAVFTPQSPFEHIRNIKAFITESNLESSFCLNMQALFMYFKFWCYLEI